MIWHRIFLTKSTSNVKPLHDDYCANNNIKLFIHFEIVSFFLQLFCADDTLIQNLTKGHCFKENEKVKAVKIIELDKAQQKSS